MRPPTEQQPVPPPVKKNAVPVMPRIPGVSDRPPQAQLQLKPLLIVIVATILCVSGFALWLSHRRHADATALVTDTPAAPAVSIPASVPSQTHTDPRAIATLDELAAPWSSKKFNFVDPKTKDNVAAMVIRLPGSGPSFWGFSLSAPLTRCLLQYVTDPNVLSQRFGYPATHPMVVSDCDGTLYDPLKMATLADGSWSRGEIVRGGGIRPPIAIQIEVHGDNLIADRME